MASSGAAGLMGLWLGALDGELLGDSEGDELLGDSVGVKVGDELIGASVGVLEGEELLGDSDGASVGAPVGVDVMDVHVKLRRAKLPVLTGVCVGSDERHPLEHQNPASHLHLNELDASWRHRRHVNNQQQVQSHPWCRSVTNSRQNIHGHKTVMAEANLDADSIYITEGDVWRAIAVVGRSFTRVFSRGNRWACGGHRRAWCL